MFCTKGMQCLYGSMFLYLRNALLTPQYGFVLWECSTYMAVCFSNAILTRQYVFVSVLGSVLSV